MDSKIHYRACAGRRAPHPGELLVTRGRISRVTAYAGMELGKPKLSPNQCPLCLIFVHFLHLLAPRCLFSIRMFKRVISRPSLYTIKCLTKMLYTIKCQYKACAKKLTAGAYPGAAPRFFVSGGKISYLYRSLRARRISVGAITVMPPRHHLSGGKLLPLPYGGAAHGRTHLLHSCRHPERSFIR